MDEDIIDGTLAADHRAVVLTSIDYLDPHGRGRLEQFAADGGLVLLTGDCTVEIRGAVKLAVSPRMPDQAKIDELSKAGKWGEMGPYTTTAKYFAGALPLAPGDPGRIGQGRHPAGLRVRRAGHHRHAPGRRRRRIPVRRERHAGRQQSHADRITPKAAAATDQAACRRPAGLRRGARRAGRRSSRRKVRNWSARSASAPARCESLARTARPIGGVRAGDARRATETWCGTCTACASNSPPPWWTTAAVC